MQSVQSGAMGFHVPALYPILDSSLFPAERQQRDAWLRAVVDDLGAAGVLLLQLRAKGVADEILLLDAATVRDFAGERMRLILNDRVELCRGTRFDGVHLGQTDMPIEAARSRLGSAALLGLSTHTPAQVQAGNATSADYLAIGPVFATQSKADAEPVIGLQGLRAARALTTKPLVAIGGITLANARAARDAGADSVAVIGALFASSGQSGGSPGRIARDFLRLFRYNNL